MSESFDESKALHDAARACGFDGHTVELCYKKDAVTTADIIAVARRLPVVVKKSYLYLDRLDTTFFYDSKGFPTCAFAGILTKPSDDYDHMPHMVSRMSDMLDAMETARDHALMEIEAGEQA